MAAEEQDARVDQVEEEFAVYGRRNTQFLYDLIVSHPLEWLLLTVHWVHLRLRNRNPADLLSAQACTRDPHLQ